GLWCKTFALYSCDYSGDFMTTFGLGSSQAPPQPDPLPTATAAAHAEMKAILSRGSSWLFWIGGLSLVNTFTMLAGSTWVFLAGLGITQLAGELARNAGGPVRIVAVMINTFGRGPVCDFWAVCT